MTDIQDIEKCRLVHYSDAPFANGDPHIIYIILVK